MFQNAEGLQCDLPVGAFQRHPHLTLQAPLDLMGHIVQEAEKLTLLIGSIKELSLSCLNPLKTGSFSKYSVESYTTRTNGIQVQRGPSIIMCISHW